MRRFQKGFSCCLKRITFFNIKFSLLQQNRGHKNKHSYIWSANFITSRVIWLATTRDIFQYRTSKVVRIRSLSFRGKGKFHIMKNVFSFLPQMKTLIFFISACYMEQFKKCDNNRMLVEYTKYWGHFQ